MPQYASTSKSYDDGDYAEEDDDVDEDDGWDCLSDYDGDMDASCTAVGGNGPSSSGDRCSDGYSSRFVHRHGRKISVSISDRAITEHSNGNRRDHHNHLERKRRASIKGSYSDLREAIPNLRGSKASRAVTLRRAAEYIDTLTKSNHEHSFCVDELTRQNEILERQVRNLYRNYQRLDNNEFVMTQSAVAQSGITVNQTGPSVSYNISPISSTWPVTLRSSISSTKTSVPNTTTQALICDSNSSGRGSGRSVPARFSIPVRIVSQPSQPNITMGNASSSDPPSTGIPSSGLVQLSYAASQIQQYSSTSPAMVTAKPQVSAPTVTANPSPSTRIITLEPQCVVLSSTPPDVRQRVRLSNSLSTSSGGRPIVVVSTSPSSCGAPVASTNFSTLDTAVLKARMARPLLEQQKPRHHHVVIGSNVEVVSSSVSPAVATSVASASNMSLPTQVLGQPRRVVIVSAQHHQQCPSLSAQGASALPSKPSPH